MIGMHLEERKDAVCINKVVCYKVHCLLTSQKIKPFAERSFCGYRSWASPEGQHRIEKHNNQE